jgi:PEP-CTERM motif
MSATGQIVVNIDANNADPGFGATALLAGLLTAPFITINGGADVDVLNYLGALGTLSFEAGDPTSGTISGAGFATITFHGIESVTGNVQVPVAAVPEPASLLLLGTGLLAGRRFRRRLR